MIVRARVRLGKACPVVSRDWRARPEGRKVNLQVFSAFWSRAEAKLCAYYLTPGKA